MVTQDQEAAVLLVDQARTAGSLDLLAFNMASVAAQALLASEGYDLERVLAALDYWMESASCGVPSAQRAGTPRHDRPRPPGRGGRGPGRVRTHPRLRGPGHIYRASHPRTLGRPGPGRIVRGRGR